MKKLTVKAARYTILVSGMLMGLAGNANAGTCGQGFITEVSEGAHNQSGLMIKIDYVKSSSAHAGTETYGFILYPETMPENKLRAIRSMAMLALASGVEVKTWSHNGNCSSATELALIGG